VHGLALVRSLLCTALPCCMDTRAGLALVRSFSCVALP